MNEFSPEQPQAARQFSSVGGTHDPLMDESGLSIEPTPAESRQSTMSTNATDRLAIGEIGAEAPAGQLTNEQAGSHDCKLVVAPTGQGITASLEARAGRTLIFTESNFVQNMTTDSNPALTPSEEEVQKPASVPSVQPQSSNGCTPEVASGSPVSTLSNTSENKSEGVNLPAAVEGEPFAEAESGSSATTNSTHTRAMNANQTNPVSSGHAEEDAQGNSCVQTVQPSVELNACAASPGETEQIASPQSEPPSSVSTASINPDAAAEATASAEADNNNSNTITTMSTNNDTPANGSVSDVNAVDVTNITPENAAAIASANLNSGTDCATTSDTTMHIDTNTNAVAPASEGASFDPILISSGHPCDAMGVGPITREVGGNGFAITKTNAKIRVKLTVDDGGTLTLRHQESQQEFSFGASLPDGEWPQLDNPDYWQTDTERDVPKGHYSVTGFVTNTGKAHSQNRIMMRYEIYLVAGEDTIDPIPPDEPKKETVICCECGGCEEKDGDGEVIATIDLPGESFMGQCFLKSQFEKLQQQTAAVNEGDEETTTVTVPGGLKYTSAWNWKAAYDAESSSISVTPPNGPALNFAIVEGSATAILTGNSRKYQYSMQLLDEDGNLVTSGMPDVLKLVAADGTQVRFNASSGDVLTIRTSSGRLVSAEQFGNNVCIKTDGNKFIQSAYSATDGLMLTSTQDNGSTQYAWYAPEQVTVVGGEYQTSGDPYKTENYLTTVTNGVKTTVITRQQTGLPAHTITRVENGNTTTITKGTGDEAIIRTIAKNYLGNNVMETIESVHRASDTTPASCTRKLELRTDGGWVILEQTEGYGSDVAQTTKYEYDSHFRVSRINYHNGSYNRYEYDSEGREVLAAELWAGGYEKVIRTAYADSRFYDNRPATVTEYRVNSAGSEVLFRTTTYTYEDSDAEEKVTTTVTAGGSSQQQVSISSNYGESASYAYAAGKAKFSQAVNGVQTWHDYEATTEHGAIHKHTVTTKASGELIAAQSRKNEAFIAANDTIVFEQESIWDGSQWLLLNTTEYEYDAQHRVTKTTRGNGRYTTTEWMCCGVLRQVDEDGIVTSNAYNSAHELTETSRSEVYDGDVCVTPETITEYTRDAAGRVLCATRRIGAMVTTESTEYDAIGRVTKQVDVLGRETITEYSEDGLTTIVTTPAGATFVTVQNTDGSTARVSGTGQREQVFVYDLSGNSERMTTKLPDGAILGQSITNGFDQTVVEARPNTLNGFIYTRSEFNAKGELLKQYQDTGWNTEKTAATLYEYDAFGNQVKQTLALSDTPTKDNSPVVEMAYSVESMDDGIYTVTTQTRYNAEGAALSSSRKQLMSQLSATLASKSISIDVRGNCGMNWSEYTAPSKVTSFSTIPTSSIVAEVVTVDGLTISQKNHAGITTGLAVQSITVEVENKTITLHMYRRYTASGLEVKQRDGRDNVTSTNTDVAGRTLSVTDAANATTTTIYDANHNQPSVITDAMGNTSCYKYDLRGRKIAEWGTALQPACFAYDDMNNMTSLRTFRADSEVIINDPSERSDYDETIWFFNAATGLEMSKTFADNSSVVKIYDAYNRLLTETDGRGVVKTHSYEQARGLLLGTTYSDGTTARAYTYNHLGQLTQVVDDAGTRTIGYNAYNEQETDSLLAGGKTHLITELRDGHGRSSGYTYALNGSVQQTVSTGYGTDGRIASAGFVHGGAQKLFTYSYLPGTNLLQTLVKPNNMTLTQSYEEKRDLLIGQLYKRSNTSVASRSYSYDTLGRPVTRSTSKDGSTVNDTFGYNSRSELNTAMVNNEAYAYDYDNIGNRETAQEAAESATTYESNNLNQYTAIGDFEPTYDDAGNQTTVKTTTGIWSVIYNAENRPTSFTNADNGTIVECSYDYMGRRATKKVTVNGTVTLHQRFLYRGYLQIACCDLTRSNHPCLWLLTWDPSQPVATRPLAIQKDGTWYTYGWDLTKNICEVYGQHGYIRTNYSYSPYGEVAVSNNNGQPIRWSSEFLDDEINLVYYNYRFYNPENGRWLSREPLSERETHGLYSYVYNIPTINFDILGLKNKPEPKTVMGIEVKGNIIASGKFGKDSFNLTLPIDGVFEGKLETKQNSKTTDAITGNFTLSKLYAIPVCTSMCTPQGDSTLQINATSSIITSLKPTKEVDITIPAGVTLNSNMGGIALSANIAVEDVKNRELPQKVTCSASKEKIIYILGAKVTANLSINIQAPTDPSRWTSEKVKPGVGGGISIGNDDSSLNIDVSGDNSSIGGNIGVNIKF